MVKKKSPSSDKIRGHVYTSELLDRRWISKTAFEIELARPSSFDFIPGQCICFIHESVERYYSLISAPDDPRLGLCIHFVKGGIFSPLLSSASIGAPFNFTGPRGYFIFRPSERPPVFIASGTGIAPFLSIGRSGVTGFTLLHEAQKPEELYYESFFRSSAKLYIPCLTKHKADPQAPNNVFYGNAAAYLEKHLPPACYDLYLCGRREMIRNVSLLADDRFAGSFVYREVYY